MGVVMSSSKDQPGSLDMWVTSCLCASVFLAVVWGSQQNPRQGAVKITEAEGVQYLEKYTAVNVLAICIWCAFYESIINLFHAQLLPA